MDNAAITSAEPSANPFQSIAQPSEGHQGWRVAWYRGLNFRGLLAAVLLALWIAAGIVLVMNQQGKTFLEKEAYRLIEQMGNTVVTGLVSRLGEVAALDRTLASVSRVLPKENEQFLQGLPKLIDFGGDKGVAGGGYWPEPFKFDTALERRSFFWGRDKADQLQYFDDYNQPGPGYHHEEWYVPAKYSADNKCYWSQSYTDPYSFQPMVTCTVPVRDSGELIGVSTIDMRLEGLAAFANDWSKRTGGYIFLVDRHNRFITYADTSKVKRIGADDKGNRTEEFILASELASKETAFTEAANALNDMNKDIITSAKNVRGDEIATIANKIDEGSYQVDASQATLIASVLADPFKDRYTTDKSALYRSVGLQTDPVLKQPSTLFLFHVPGPYWKLGIIKPVAETVAVASSITQLLIGYLLGTVLLAILLAYGLFNRLLIRPVTRISGVVRTMGVMLAERRHHELGAHHIEYRARNEIGLLADNINSLADGIVTSEGKLAEANALLERRVQERTQELSMTLRQLKSSQAQLVQSEKMASLGQMVAGIAHEINTPLGYVKNNILLSRELLSQLQGLLQRANSLSALQVTEPSTRGEFDQVLLEMLNLAKQLQESGLEEDVVQLINDSLYGVEQISELVLNLRNFSRLDEAKVKEIDVHECIDSALNIARNVLKNKVEVIKDFGSVPLISCAPSQINQVFINLFNNAAQAIDGNGKLYIKTFVEKDAITIWVQDTGQGISRENLNKIFEPFFTTKPVGQGTGLGLSITFQIIRQHGGRIRVASEVGKGTRFIISLPLQHQSEGKGAVA